MKKFQSISHMNGGALIKFSISKERHEKCEGKWKKNIDEKYRTLHIFVEGFFLKIDERQWIYK